MRFAATAAFALYLIYVGVYSVYYIAGLRSEPATQDVQHAAMAARSFAALIPRGSAVCVASRLEVAYLPDAEHVGALYALPGRRIASFPEESPAAPTHCFVIYSQTARVAAALEARRIAVFKSLMLARPQP